MEEIERCRGSLLGLAAGDALGASVESMEREGMDLADQLERYVRWRREGHMSSVGHCFDIGNTTSDALRRFERTGDPHSGSTDPNAAGNGSIMRLAPCLFSSRTTRRKRFKNPAKAR